MLLGLRIIKSISHSFQSFRWFPFQEWLFWICYLLILTDLNFYAIKKIRVQILRLKIRISWNQVKQYKIHGACRWKSLKSWRYFLFRLFGFSEKRLRNYPKAEPPEGALGSNNNQDILMTFLILLTTVQQIYFISRRTVKLLQGCRLGYAPKQESGAQTSRPNTMMVAILINAE